MTNNDCTLEPTPGTIDRRINGREYFVNVPAGLPGPAVPLLLGLHGFLQTPDGHEKVTGWSEIAASRKFIVAYPSAQPQRSAWDFSEGSDDVGYLNR